MEWNENMNTKDYFAKISVENEKPKTERKVCYVW